MKIRGSNLTTCFHFCKCFSNRNVSCDVCIWGKKNAATNYESSGNVDELLQWSCCSSVEPLRLYSSWSKIKLVRSKFLEASFLKQVSWSKFLEASWPLVASGWIEPHRFNRAAVRSLKQFFYITRAFWIGIMTNFFVNCAPQKEPFLNEHAYFNQPEVVTFSKSLQVS